jgi:acyl dehydratase
VTEDRIKTSNAADGGIASETAMPPVGSAARRTRTVSRRDIELFTEMTGDRNPLHYDEELARRTRFGGLIVQGGVTSGLLNAVVAESLPGPGSVFLRTAWNFLAPVRPGDEITAEVEVLERHATKPVVRLRTTVTNQAGVVVLDGDAHVFRLHVGPSPAISSEGR